MLQLQLCTLQAMVTIISERFKVRTDQAKIIYINEDSNALFLKTVQVTISHVLFPLKI